MIIKQRNAAFLLLILLLYVNHIKSKSFNSRFYSFDAIKHQSIPQDISSQYFINEEDIQNRKNIIEQQKKGKNNRKNSDSNLSRDRKSSIDDDMNDINRNKNIHSNIQFY
jgi:hypothetical protein